MKHMRVLERRSNTCVPHLRGMGVELKRMTLSGWIVYNANSGQQSLSHAQRFEQVAKDIGIRVQVMGNNTILAQFQGQQPTLFSTKRISLPDFALFWDKDKYLARQLEILGVRLFNSATAIESCDDKCIMYQRMSHKSISIPRTIVAPKVHPWNGPRDFDQYIPAAEALGFPLVVKEAFGSYGDKVYLIRDKKELVEKLEEIEGIPFLFQEFVSSSFGRDIRVQVVGGVPVASMLRVSMGDFRSNIAKGAKYTKHQLTEQQRALALLCADALELDFGGVDLLFGPREEPIVCEVNSNAHVLKISDCTGVDVPYTIMKHIVTVMSDHR